MNECKNCRKTIDSMSMMTCPSCGANICLACAEASQKICPYCYSTLEYTD